jgi:hypothetical protein
VFADEEGPGALPGPGRALAGGQQLAYPAGGQMEASRHPGDVEEIPVEEGTLVGVGGGALAPAPPRRASAGEELFAGLRVAAVEERLELGLPDLAPQSEVFGEGTDPAPGGLPVAEVVRLRRGGHLAEVIVGGAGAEPADVEHRVGSSCGDALRLQRALCASGGRNPTTPD